jgi:hypothetical protein
VVQNSSHILYLNSSLTFAQKMVTENSCLSLYRPNATVGANTKVILKGSLPNFYPVNLIQYPLTINFQLYGALNSTEVELVLFSYTNPLTSYN